MYGVTLTYLLTASAILGGLRYPVYALYVYIGLAIVRPHFIWGWAGDLTGLSYWVGISMLAGWLFRGFGRWRFGKASGVVYALLGFVVWFMISGAVAIDPGESFLSLEDFAKLVLPVLVGVTLLGGEMHPRRLLWTIVLSQGYVAFEQNLNYVNGFNTAATGFGGMDNNCFGAGLVTVVGPAVAMTIASRTWYERLAASAAAALILHTVLLTFSRGAMVGLLAVGVTAFVMMPKRPKNVIAVLLALAVVLRFTGPELADRYATVFVSAEERDVSAESRLDLWRDCLMVIGQYPVFGVGPANWVIVASDYGWPAGKSAHSVWMETAAETGLPGALLLFSFFSLAALRLWPIARARRKERTDEEVTLAAGVVLSIVGFVVAGQFVSVPGLEVPYYVILAGIVMLKHRGRAVEAEPVAAPAAIPPPFQAVQPKLSPAPAGGRGRGRMIQWPA